MVAIVWSIGPSYVRVYVPIYLELNLNDTPLLYTLAFAIPFISLQDYNNNPTLFGRKENQHRIYSRYFNFRRYLDVSDMN